MDPSLATKKKQKRKAPKPPNPFTGEVEEDSDPLADDSLFDAEDEEVSSLVPRRPSLMAELSKVLPLSAHCLSPLRVALISELSKVLPLSAHCLSPLRIALMAEWSKVLPLSAHCLSPLRACPDG